MNPHIAPSWQKEPGARIAGSRPLDSAKLQAPGVARTPTGAFRLYYTAVGPAKPFPTCQGYILSAVSEDGLTFRKEPGIRIAPQPDVPHGSLRLLAPSIHQYGDGRWRMYFESRGPADKPPVICSAVSSDMLHWELEDGIRLQSAGGAGAPRYLPLPDGRARLYCTTIDAGPGERKGTKGVISAITNDGLHFELEPGYRLRAKQSAYDTRGISAAEVIPPAGENDQWTIVYSAWQDVEPGTVAPVHPSSDANAVASGLSEDFAAASIASDLAGYRSRIFVAHSSDGLAWGPDACVIAGGGHDAADIDAVHAEDMSVIKIGENSYRMYYAACDRDGNWRIASAVTK